MAAAGNAAMQVTGKRLLVIHPPAARPPPAVAAMAAESMNWGPSLCLVAATAIAGLVGTPLGLLLGLLLVLWTDTGQMSPAPWVGLVQAHGQAQLFGWIGLSILGVTWHAMAHLFHAPEAPGRAVFAVLALQLLGVALRVVAPLVPGNTGTTGAWLVVASALALLAAFAITLVVHVGTLSRRSPEHRGPAVLPRFLLAGLLLWLAALLANLDGGIQALRHGLVVPGALGATRDAFIVAAVAGGMALIAAGMSLRVVVGWADLPPPDLWRAGQAWWPLAGAVVLRSLRPGVQMASPLAGTWLEVVGALLWAGGVVWYLPVLRGLWSPETVRPGGGVRGQADPPLAWFIRTAYAWFALTGALALAQAALAAGAAAGLAVPSIAGLADAERHALLLGYLGMLVAGLTGRLPIRFLDLGDDLIDHTRSAYHAAWLLLLTATALRVPAPLLGDSRPWFIALSGVTGALALWCLLAVLTRIALAAYRRDRLDAANVRT